MTLAIDTVKRHADDIAYVAEEDPTTDLDGFIAQLAIAAMNFDGAGINGHEDLEAAATFLAEAKDTASDSERKVFLRKADKLLNPVGDMTDEYRDMVGD